MSEKRSRKRFSELSEPVLRDPVRRARVAEHKRAMRKALALAELRKAREITQQSIATEMDVSQANISRVEHQDDVFLSTLRGYVAALGGRLELRAVFPDETVELDLPSSQG